MRRLTAGTLTPETISKLNFILETAKVSESNETDYEVVQGLVELFPNGVSL